jgi:hypothetical protein
MSDTEDPVDVGDEGVVKVKAEKRKNKRQQEVEDLRNLLSTQAGRSFMWRLLSYCGVYKTSFTGNSTTFFNEGKRQVGLHLLDEVFEADANAFSKMQTEAVERGERK